MKYKIYRQGELDWTMQLYPEMAKDGWAFWCNRYNKYSLDKKREKRLIIEQKGKMYGITDVLFAEEEKAYDFRKDVLPTYSPIFIKTRCIKTLKALNFIFPHQRQEVNRFELMDLE